MNMPPVKNMRRFKRILGLPLLFWAAAAFAQNPYLPLWEHVPDGEPRVFDDPDQPGKQRVYIIGSHDTQRKKYCGVDTHMWLRLCPSGDGGAGGGEVG